MALFLPLYISSPTQKILSSPLPFHKPPQHKFQFVPSVSLKVPTKSRRFGLCECQKVFSVQAQLTNQTSVLGETVQEEVAKEDDYSKTRVIAQNVPWNSTVDDLRPLFEKYGAVLDIELSMYNKTRNRGLAFVTMGSHEEALSAITNLELYEYQGRVLRLNWANPKPTKPVTPPSAPKPMPVHNLFVANLPFQARANDLKDFFDAVSADIVFLENPRRSAGYGFVSFNTKVEAEAALSAFQEKEFMGRQIRVARSKRFLRQGPKATIESDNSSARLESSNPVGKADES